MKQWAYSPALVVFHAAMAVSASTGWNEIGSSPA